MLTTFLIVLGILALLGAGDAGDACAITLLLKVLPFLIIVGIVVVLVFCGGQLPTPRSKKQIHQFPISQSRFRYFLYHFCVWY